jgi:hypothetical protein
MPVPSFFPLFYGLLNPTQFGQRPAACLEVSTTQFGGTEMLAIVIVHGLANFF